jgi:gamma-glutamylcyclotransferase (GGCT)/AIG2-like uncharacterized protein YtfP
MIYYFAFGSNMSPVQTPRRCPGARPVGPATLEGWRFWITTRGGASMVPEQGAVAHGVLWRFEPHHVGLMDRWEGISVGVYRRVWLRVRHPRRGTVTALTYIADGRWPGRPKANYINSAILVGAEAFALPADYRDEICAWLPRRPIGANEAYRGRRTPKPARPHRR